MTPPAPLPAPGHRPARPGKRAPARDEGEGYDSAEDWRRGHEEFWHSQEYREATGQPGFTALVVAMRFRLTEDLRGRQQALTAFRPCPGALRQPEAPG